MNYIPDFIISCVTIKLDEENEEAVENNNDEPSKDESAKPPANNKQQGIVKIKPLTHSSQTLQLIAHSGFKESSNTAENF